MRVEELTKMYELEDTYWWFVARRRLVRGLVEKYGPASPRILDVGCGTGGTLDALGGLGESWGADISEDALDFCRRRGHEHLQRCPAENLGFEDASFDVAICCDVVEHLEEDALAFAEVMRVLKPGGVAIITVPAYPFLWSEHDEALSHRRRYTKAGLRNRLQESGARIVKLTYAVSFVFPAVGAFRLLARLRLRRMGTPHTQVGRLPGWINRLLIAISDVENRIVLSLGCPFGTSLVAVARKPG